MPGIKGKSKAARKPSKKAPSKAKKAKQASNVISFSELFELKKKKLAEAQQARQTGWKDGTTGSTHEDSVREKFQGSARNGRTNGMGSRHH